MSRRRAAALLTVVLMAGCGDGSAVGISTAAPERVEQVAAWFPEASQASVNAVASADACPEPVQIDEPQSLTFRLSETGGWLRLDTDAAEAMATSAIRSELGNNVVAVQAAGEVLSEPVPDTFIISLPTLGRIQAEVRRADHVLLGTPRQSQSAAVSAIALYPDGLAAFLVPCGYPFFTAPLLEVAATRDVTPEELIRIFIDDRDSAEATAWLQDAAALGRGEDPYATEEAPADPRNQVLNPEDTPAEVLRELVPYTIELRAPRSWALPGGMVCTFAGAGWNDCAELTVINQLGHLPLTGYAIPGEIVEVVLFPSDGPLDAPLATMLFMPYDSMRQADGDALVAVVEAVYEPADLADLAAASDESATLEVSNEPASNEPASETPGDGESPQRSE